VRVTFCTDVSIDAPVLQTDPVWDLALLQIPETVFEPLHLAEVDPKIGDCIRFIGFPSAQKKPRGVHTRVIQYARPQGETVWGDLEAGSEPVYGDSGGPMIGTESRVVALTSAGGNGSGATGPMSSQIKLFLGRR
jgi:hypothetical protein